MEKKFLIIFIFLFLVGISGCTSKEATNGTFGEKTISTNNITIINNVTANHTEYQETNYYYITGYLKNNNKYDVFHLKMKATTFDAEGNVVAVNDTVYLNPKVISAEGEAFFGFRFTDNDNRIVRYELQLISADAGI